MTEKPERKYKPIEALAEVLQEEFEEHINMWIHNGMKILDNTTLAEAAEETAGLLLE